MEQNNTLGSEAQASKPLTPEELEALLALHPESATDGSLETAHVTTDEAEETDEDRVLN